MVVGTGKAGLYQKKRYEETFPKVRTTKPACALREKGRMLLVDHGKKKNEKGKRGEGGFSNQRVPTRGVKPLGRKGSRTGNKLRTAVRPVVHQTQRRETLNKKNVEEI